MDETAPQRVGDSERHRVVDRLAEGFSSGRLTLQEYDERLVEALAARTTHDLAPLVVDLAAEQAPSTDDAAARRRQDLREWLREWQYWAGAAVLLVGVWGVRSVADGDPERFWPGVPLGIWAVVLLAVAVWPSDD